MKRLITFIALSVITLTCCFADTIHFDHAYLMKKDSEGACIYDTCTSK